MNQTTKTRKMCRVVKSTKRTKYVGWKVLALKRDTKELYSSFTGQLFEPGIVIKPPLKGFVTRLAWCWSNELDDHHFCNSSFFNRDFYGKTALFETMKEAKEALHWESGVNTDYQLVLCKVTLKGKVWVGSYGSKHTIYCGTYVHKIELKMKNERIDRKNVWKKVKGGLSWVA